MDTTNKQYEPDSYYYMINYLWNFLWFSFGVMGLFYLLGPHENYDIDYFCIFFMIFGVWLGIFSTHVSIRRFDRKYKDRLLSDPRAGSFVIIPIAFSRETIIKCRWCRWFVYFPGFKKWPALRQLRHEIMPEFDYKRDVKFWDKFLLWGQFISLGIATILSFWVKW